MKFFENFGKNEAIVASKDLGQEKKRLATALTENNQAGLDHEAAIRRLEMADVIHEMDAIEREISRSGESPELSKKLAELQSQLDSAGVVRN